MNRITGLTMALAAGSTHEALDFYSGLLGRAPDFAPHDDFFEWEISPRAWLQLSTEHDEPVPSSARVRFDVPDVRESARLLRARGTAISGVVAGREPVPDGAAPMSSRIGSGPGHISGYR